MIHAGIQAREIARHDVQFDLVESAGASCGAKVDFSAWIGTLFGNSLPRNREGALDPEGQGSNQPATKAPVLILRRVRPPLFAARPAAGEEALSLGRF